MASQYTVDIARTAPVAISLQDATTFKELAAFLSKFSDIEVMRHWSTHPLPGAPEILDDAVGVFPDLEWYDNSRMPKVPVKITEVGLTVFPMAALRECKSPTDFPALVSKAAVYHIRILDNCHMRNKGRIFEDAEKNSLYCETRFVAEDETEKIFVDFLNNRKTKDGRKAPVILVGQGWNKDEEQLRKHWKLNVNKLDSVVHKIHSLGTLSQQAGIIPKADRAAGQRNPKFDELLAGFGVDLEGLWRHNGANDAVYQMTLAFLVMLFPILYPTTSGGYPPDASIAGQSIKEIWTDLALANKQVPPPTWGVSQFCHYCETVNAHDAVDCRIQSTIICQLCSNAVGKKNKTYRDKAAGHQTSRCLFQYNHHVRNFPQWFLDLQPSEEDKRVLSKASAVKDFETIGEIMYRRFFEPGWIGRDEVADEERRLELEEGMYSDGDGEDKGDLR